MKTTKCLSFTLLLLFTFAGAYSQQSLLQSGPMIGYVDMFEACLWVQTTQPASVRIEYFETTNPTKHFSTKTLTTTPEDGYAAHLVATSLLPGKKYTYQLFINNKKVEKPYPFAFQTQALWRWRTDPPTLTFALGSCAYINETEYDRPGKPYGGDYQIFTSIAAKKPDMMLWMGDNLYLREPDWNTWTGILHRYTHTRSLPEMQELLATTPNYAIWDDHDYGPNDSDRSFWNKEMTKKAFQLFWANPNAGASETGGTTGTFEWGDAQFFLMDDRWYRSPNEIKSEEKQFFGDKQIKWLVDALVSSPATFKFVVVGGQVLSPVASNENYATYPEERAKLLALLKKNNLKNVIFLTGDRHFTELTALDGMYDLTVSPLTSSPATSPLPNPNRLENTFVGERNFATITLKGGLKSRIMEIRVFDSNGKERWTKEIAAEK